MALRTEDVPLFPSRDFAFLTDDEAADWRVVVWRPTVVVLSDDGVCRADEDALCLGDGEDLAAELLCRVEDVVRCLAEVVPARLSCDAETFLFVTEDDGLETDV